MATDREIDKHIIVEKAEEYVSITHEVEQAYRNAYVDGFQDCVKIIEVVTNQTKGKMGQTAYRVLWMRLVDYCQYRLQMWQISSVNKDKAPPEFFTSHS